MDHDLRKLLSENDYLLVEIDNHLMVKRKVISSVGPMLIFTIIGGIVLLAAAVLLLEGSQEFGIPTFIIGLIIFCRPFVGFVIAPYRGLVINFSDRTLLFRSKYSRAYKFSEVDSLELIVNQSDADTNSFSTSNQEYRYYLNILFWGGDKEELFKLTSDTNIDRDVDQIKTYFANVMN